ncbi:MAG: glutamate racemase [Woeseia sp.]|nr:glutamate racemase [Woeseia sp.]NNE61532.1 glutamate racemase [Woeseia sp.]NNL54128.1 glutamate racemase [Woeseia sp.]
MENHDARPIGVFDSGVGGLTVLQAARAVLPAEHFIYLGDTARLPYGTKSPDTVRRYAERAAAFLGQHDIKLLVIACNTASAVALSSMQKSLAPLPVVGVVEPGARAAVAAMPAARHLVLATEATVRLHAYRDAVLALDPAARVDELACELLVALAEEGWTNDAIAVAAIRRYLEPYFENGTFRPQSLILGCTHFPLLRHAVREVVGADVAIVDSAKTTAEVVKTLLRDQQLLAPPGRDGALNLLATDGAGRFARVGGNFLGQELSTDDVHLADL